MTTLRTGGTNHDFSRATSSTDTKALDPAPKTPPMPSQSKTPRGTDTLAVAAPEVADRSHEALPLPPDAGVGQPAWTFVSHLAEMLEKKLPAGMTMKVVADSPETARITFSYGGGDVAVLTPGEFDGKQGFTLETLRSMTCPNEVKDKLKLAIGDLDIGYPVRGLTGPVPFEPIPANDKKVDPTQKEDKPSEENGGWVVQPAWTYLSKLAEDIGGKLPAGTTMTASTDDPKTAQIKFSYGGDVIAYLTPSEEDGKQCFKLVTMRSMNCPNEVKDKLKALLKDQSGGYPIVD